MQIHPVPFKRQINYKLPKQVDFASAKVISIPFNTTTEASYILYRVINQSILVRSSYQLIRSDEGQPCRAPVVIST